MESEREQYPPAFHPEEMKLHKVQIIDDPRDVGVSWGTATVCTIVDHGDNKHYSLWLSTVLKDKFKKLQIAPGDTVGLVFKGKPKNKNYYDWTVFLWTALVEADMKRRGIHM